MFFHAAISFIVFVVRRSNEFFLFVVPFLSLSDQVATKWSSSWQPTKVFFMSLLCPILFIPSLVLIFIFLLVEHAFCCLTMCSDLDAILSYYFSEI